MTMPLNNGRPGRSQMSHGRGRFPHPDSNVHRPELVFPQGEDENDIQLRRQAELRLDATNANETVEEMYFAKGNPDAFGPGAPLVQEGPVTRTGSYPQPNYRTGVDREE